MHWIPILVAMKVSYPFLTVQERARLREETCRRQQQEAANSTVSSFGSSLPMEWEEKTKQLHVKWDEVQRKQSKSQLGESGYEESLFMFKDGILPFPSHFVSNYSLSFFSDDDVLLEQQKKRLMQRVHVFANHLMRAPRVSKRFPVFKDIAPN